MESGHVLGHHVSFSLFTSGNQILTKIGQLLLLWVSLAPDGCESPLLEMRRLESDNCCDETCGFLDNAMDQGDRNRSADSIDEVSVEPSGIQRLFTNTEPEKIAIPDNDKTVRTYQKFNTEKEFKKSILCPVYIRQNQYQSRCLNFFPIV